MGRNILKVLLFVACLIIVGFVGTDSQPVSVKADSKTSKKMAFSSSAPSVVDHGSKTKLKLENKAKNAKIRWTVSDKKIATISKKGTLKAKKQGTVTVTATDLTNNVSVSKVIKVTYSPEQARKDGFVFGPFDSDGYAYLEEYTGNAKVVEFPWFIDEITYKCRDNSFRGNERIEELDLSACSHMYTIYPYAYAGCINLKKVALPENLSIIHWNAFFDCIRLESINIPDTVFKIEMAAFMNCYSLKEITLPDSLKTIREIAFRRCISLREIEIPKSVETIGYLAFCECFSLEKLTIQEGIDLSVEQSTGMDFVDVFTATDSLKLITIPDSLEVIDLVLGAGGADTLLKIGRKEYNLRNGVSFEFLYEEGYLDEHIYYYYGIDKNDEELYSWGKETVAAVRESFAEDKDMILAETRITPDDTPREKMIKFWHWFETEETVSKSSETINGLAALAGVNTYYLNQGWFGGLSVPREKTENGEYTEHTQVIIDRIRKSKTILPWVKDDLLRSIAYNLDDTSIFDTEKEYNALRFITDDGEDITESLKDRVESYRKQREKEEYFALSGIGSITLGNWNFEYKVNEKTGWVEKKENRDIEWAILDYSADGKKALVVSRYSICTRPFNEQFGVFLWENCSLRRWLNTEFYESAFSDKEKERILETTVVNEDNDIYGTDGGNNTRDHIFLLSLSEVDKYFESNGRYECADSRICREIGNRQIDWLLRSPGQNGSMVATVDYGQVYDTGCGNGGMYVMDGASGVRPAMWIELDSELKSLITKNK